MPRVDIIYAYVDMPGDLIDAAVANGARGIVIAGVGNGNMTKAAVTAAANAVKKGVMVVRSSRVMTGLVGRNVELNDDELGFIASDELNPQKARILLSLALLKKPTAGAAADDVPHLLDPAIAPARCPFRKRNGHGTGESSRSVSSEPLGRSRRQREASDYRRKLAGAGRLAGAPRPMRSNRRRNRRRLPGPRNRRHHGGRRGRLLPGAGWSVSTNTKGRFGSIRFGGGFLYDYAAYDQDANSKEQFPDLSPEWKMRDSRSCFTEVSRPSGRSAGAPASCTTGPPRSG